MEGYRTIAAPAQEEFVEKRSRFIGQIAPVEGEEEALAFINAPTMSMPTSCGKTK